jgi:uroporphyrinogen III methyltransferase/synthase
MATDKKDLLGLTILVSRPREQSAGLTEGLRMRGADVVEAPTIRIEPPSDWAEVDGAIRRIDSYHWIIFTSVNGVKFFLERMDAIGIEQRSLSKVKLAAIGPATRDELEARGFAVDVVPERFVAEEVFEALKASGPLKGCKALLPRADIARKALPELLRKEGVDLDVVVAYRTAPSHEDIRRAIELVSRGSIDVVTFTSGSTVRNFFSAVEDLLVLQSKFLPASIGPITSQTLREYGFEPAIEAREYTSDGLITAIVDYFANRTATKEGDPRSDLET